MDTPLRSGGHAPAPSHALSQLERLLRSSSGPEGAFDVADFVSEALDALTLEQLRSFLLGRLEATRSEVRMGCSGVRCGLACGRSVRAGCMWR